MEIVDFGSDAWEYLTKREKTVAKPGHLPAYCFMERERILLAPAHPTRVYMYVDHMDE